MQSIISFAKRYPYACLLCVQLLSVIFYGYLGDSHLSQLVFSCFGLLVPILAVWVVYRTPAISWVAYVLVVPAILFTLLAGFAGYSNLLLWAHAFESLVYFYAAISLVMHMFEDDVVTVDELYAAAATFTLLVWGFALLYSVCQQLYPHSITAAINPDGDRSWMELLFMSFSVQSGTGMGDIMPISGQARVISIFQMFTGVMYIAIVVSRLVGLALVTKK
jgi:hypothetical protein